MEQEKTTHKKVTLYMEGGFGYTKTEVKEFEYWRAEYAQYKNAVRFRFLAPRKRKWQGGTLTYNPTMVVLDGWGHMDPDDPMTAPRTEGVFEVRETRHSMFDKAYGEEFAAKLAAYLETSGATVLADFRGVNTATKAA